MEVPETRYTLSGDVNIAYQVVGEGPIDLVFIPSMTHHVELVWENPSQAQFFSRLASISRLLLFDKRGTGMSDRVAGGTLEVRMDDIRAVMDAAGTERAVLCGLGDGGPLCALFAATYPERTTALVLINTTPRFVRSPELPWLPTRAERERDIEEVVRRWGNREAAAEFFRRGSPSATEEERQSFARVITLSVSPGSAAAYLRMNLDVDICDVLPLIRVPTLVMQRTEIEVLDRRNGRYLAEHIPGARLVELPGRDFAPQLGAEPMIGGPAPQPMNDATITFLLQTPLDASHLSHTPTQQPRRLRLRSVPAQYHRHDLQYVPFALAHVNPVCAAVHRKPSLTRSAKEDISTLLRPDISILL